MLSNERKATVQVAAAILRLEQELEGKNAMLREQQVQTRLMRRFLLLLIVESGAQALHEVLVLQKLQLQERLRDTQAKLVVQKQHDNGLHTLLSRSMDRLEVSKDALMLADEHLARYKM